MKFLKRLLFQIGYPLALVYWFFTRPEVVGVRVLVFNSKGEVLLVKHTYRGSYFLPGGRVDKGESLEDCARREVFEETNIKIDQLGIHGIYRKFIDYKHDNLIVFSTSDVENEDEILADDIEILEAKWFSLDNLPTDIHAGMLRRIQEYAKNSNEVFTKW